jgi:hypothetical protein
VKSGEHFPSEEKSDDVLNAPFPAIIPRSERVEQVEVIPIEALLKIATLCVALATLIINVRTILAINKEHRKRRR